MPVFGSASVWGGAAPPSGGSLWGAAAASAGASAPFGGRKMASAAPAGTGLKAALADSSPKQVAAVAWSGVCPVVAAGGSSGRAAPDIGAAHEVPAVERCPNRLNPYHVCVQYCVQRYGQHGGETGDAGRGAGGAGTVAAATVAAVGARGFGSGGAAAPARALWQGSGAGAASGSGGGSVTASHRGVGGGPAGVHSGRDVAPDKYAYAFANDEAASDVRVDPVEDPGFYAPQQAAPEEKLEIRIGSRKDLPYK